MSQSVLELPDDSFDVCIVGTGPVGAALAHVLVGKGCRVLCLEAGGQEPKPATTALAAADLGMAENHKPVESVVCRALGGTSRLWGGRCVPFDALDFAERSHVPYSGWPLKAADVTGHYGEALAFLGCARDGLASSDTPAEKALGAQNIVLHREAFADETRLDRTWRNMMHSGKVQVSLNSIVRKLIMDPDGGSVRGLLVRHAGQDHQIHPAKSYVLACGGLDNARVLLNTQSDAPGLAGGPEGPLGRYYQCHFGARFAEITLANPVDGAAFAYRRSGNSLLRRRLGLDADCLARHGLRNVSFGVANPRLADASHGSGILSMMYLLLASPLDPRLVSPPIREAQIAGATGAGGHMLNVVRDLPNTVTVGTGLAWQKLRHRRRYPLAHIHSPTGRYDVLSHAEQAPDPRNRAVLSPEKDSSGMRKLAVHYRISRDDAASLVAAHDVLDNALRTAGIGQLIYRVPEGERIDDVFRHNSTGTHQIGTTRMNDNPASGVVDRNCRVHGSANLFIAGSSIFPTSSHANPTLTAVALAMRLGQHLGDMIGEPPRVI